MIIDEAIFLEEEEIENLKNLKSQVASLWIAVGSISFDVQKLRKKAEDFGFTCPTLEHCLRNASKIAELSKSTKNDLSNYSRYGNLSRLSNNVKVQTIMGSIVIRRSRATGNLVFVVSKLDL